jgi:hypothetical protein
MKERMIRIVRTEIDGEFDHELEKERRVLKSLLRFFASKEFIKNTGLLTDQEFEYVFRYEQFIALDEVEECQARCFCMKEDVDAYEHIQWSDYVTTPMVWCDSCGARSVICIHCQPEIEVTELGEGRRTVVYNYPLMKVEKVLNTQLYSWQWTKELADLYLSDFLKFRQDPKMYYNDALKAEKEFAARIGLKSRDDEEDIGFDDLWDIAPIIDSLDGQKPPIPLDMRHDGTNVYFLCYHEACQNRVVVRYWGD